MSEHSVSEPVDPDGDVVPASETGYAVTSNSLRIGDDFFELDLSSAEAAAVRAAIEWDDETPRALNQCWKGVTFRGDYPALVQVVEALKRYENGGAGLGEDKMAYDARTAFNHAKYTVKDALVTDD